MKLLRSLAVAFSMYSRIPMPQVKWDKDSTRWAMAAFPLVGAALGLLFWGWGELALRLGLGALLTALGMLLLPLLITGGIHLDGFCDTVDALSSHAPREKKLEILSDPHIGAFAAMGLVGYLLSWLVLCTEIDWSWPLLLVMALAFVTSRCLSALAVVHFPSAKKSGTARTFADAAAKRPVTVILVVLLALSAAGMLMAELWVGLAVLLLSGVVFAVYASVSRRQFEGITGDLAGWFLSLCEIFSLVGILLVQVIGGAL